jgi:hypothetical protein
VNLSLALGAGLCSELRLQLVEGGAESSFLPPMMSDTNLGTVQVPFASEVAKDAEAETEAAAAQQQFKNDPARMQPDAVAEATSTGFASQAVATMPVSDDPSSQMKDVAKPAVSSGNQEGEELHQTQSSGGIAFLTALSAEALQEFDMPEYVKRHNATLTFPEKVRHVYNGLVRFSPRSRMG